MIRIIWKTAEERGNFCATVKKFSGYSCRKSSKGDLFGGYFSDMKVAERKGRYGMAEKLRRATQGETLADRRQTAAAEKPIKKGWEIHWQPCFYAVALSTDYLLGTAENDAQVTDALRELNGSIHLRHGGVVVAHTETGERFTVEGWWDKAGKK